MIIAAADINRLRGLNFPVDLILARAESSPAPPGPIRSVVFHEPGCPIARGPLGPVGTTPCVYVVCTTCEGHVTAKPPFYILVDALREANVITQYDTDSRQTLHPNPTPRAISLATNTVLAEMRALARVPGTFIEALDEYRLPLEAYFAALTAVVAGTRDAFRTWLISSFDSFDPSAQERYLLVKGIPRFSTLRCMAALAAFEQVAHEDTWAVVRAPDLTTTGMFRHDAPSNHVVDLGPVGEGLPAAAWELFAAYSSNADVTIADQRAFVNALRGACAH